MEKELKGIIFDMDGVLIDSEKVMAKAAADAFNHFGVPAVPEDFTQFCGTGEICYFGGVAGLYGGKYDIKVRNYAYETYFKIVKKEAKVYECVLPTLRYLKQKRIPMAVASSADREKVYANIDAIGVEPDFFDCVITGNDVTKNKPDPEIFNLAREKLGLQPAESVVCEDSISGVKAAKAAGCLCLGITTANSSETLIKTGADITWTGIDKLLTLF